MEKIIDSKSTVRVQFIDNATGKSLGFSELNSDKLPENFEIDTTMNLMDADWQVEEAIPMNAEEFIESGKLVLKIRKIEKVANNFLYTVASMANDFPDSNSNSSYNDFEIFIPEDEWRQKEFLQASALSNVEKEISIIKDIWENHSKNVDDRFSAFTKCHVRTIDEKLNIDFRKLKALLNSRKIGTVKIIGNSGFVKNSFAFTTDHTTFYGIVEEGNVTHLCIDSSSDESANDIEMIIEEFNLLFVNWYNCELGTKA